MKKYELTTETNREGLFRIKAVRDIPAVGVKAGDLGGFIESEKNLDHSGNAWVSGDAQVFGDARVFGDAWVFGDARIENNSEVVWISNVGSERGTLTIFRIETGIGVTRGCFSGTYDEFIEKVKETHGDNEHGRFYLTIAPILRDKVLSGF